MQAATHGGIQAGRRRDHPQRGPRRRPGDARDARRHRGDQRRRMARRGAAHRRALQRRHARLHGRPPGARGGSRRPDRGGCADGDVVTVRRRQSPARRSSCRRRDRRADRRPQPPPNPDVSGVLAKYAKLVGSASRAPSRSNATPGTVPRSGTTSPRPVCGRSRRAPASRRLHAGRTSTGSTSSICGCSGAVGEDLLAVTRTTNCASGYEPSKRVVRIDGRRPVPRASVRLRGEVDEQQPHVRLTRRCPTTGTSRCRRSWDRELALADTRHEARVARPCRSTAGGRARRPSQRRTCHRLDERRSASANAVRRLTARAVRQRRVPNRSCSSRDPRVVAHAGDLLRDELVDQRVERGRALEHRDVPVSGPDHHTRLRDQAAELVGVADRDKAVLLAQTTSTDS